MGSGAQAVILARGAVPKRFSHVLVETPPAFSATRIDISSRRSVPLRAFPKPISILLVQILNEDPDLAKHFSLVLYDNSPQPQSLHAAISHPLCP